MTAIELDAVPAVERLEEGRSAFARVVKSLLVRNSLSHSDLKAVHDWVCPNSTAWISTSQISGLRTQKLKAPGPRLFDALGQTNLVLAKISGVSSHDTDQLGELPRLPGQLRHLSDVCWFAQHPLSGLPMNAGDLFMVWLGRLDPALQDEGYSDRQARSISERLSLLVQRWMVEQQLLVRQGRDQLLSAHSSPSENRRQRFWLVLVGEAAFGGEELMTELPDLLEAIGRITCGRPLTLQEWDRWVRAGALPSR